MRVTDKMIFDNATLYTGRARAEMDRASSEAASGLRVEHPWDDPVDAGQIVLRRQAEERFDVIGEVVDRSWDELASADTALGDIGLLFAQAREIATRMSNDTYAPSDRANGATQIDSIINQIVVLANTKVGDRYIFGGMKDTAPPFNTIVGFVGQYLGDANVRMVEVAPGQLQAASVRADVALKGVGGGQDVLTALANLATALRTDDVTNVRAGIATMDAGVNQVAQARTDVGASMQLMEFASLAARTFKDAETVAVGKARDVDLMDAVTRLAQAQHALDASLTAAARSFDLSLINKLR